MGDEVIAQVGGSVMVAGDLEKAALLGLDRSLAEALDRIPSGRRFGDCSSCACWLNSRFRLRLSGLGLGSRTPLCGKACSQCSIEDREEDEGIEGEEGATVEKAVVISAESVIVVVGVSRCGEGRSDRGGFGSNRNWAGPVRSGSARFPIRHVGPRRSGSCAGGPRRDDGGDEEVEITAASSWCWPMGTTRPLASSPLLNSPYAAETDVRRGKGRPMHVTATTETTATTAMLSNPNKPPPPRQRTPVRNAAAIPTMQPAHRPQHHQRHRTPSIQRPGRQVCDCARAY